MTIRQTIFKGEETGIDKTDQDYQKAQRTQNINISTLGIISNENVGFVRQDDTALANGVVSIVQIGKGETVVHVNDL